MKFEVAHDANIAIVQLTGRLDGVTSGGVEQELLKLLNGPTRQVVVDLAGLDYISSVGLRVLLLLAKRLKPLGGQAVVCAMQPAIHQVFDIAGFANIFEVYPTRAEAVSRLR